MQVFNAIIARLWLRERVDLVDLVCYALIITGIAISAVFLPKDTISYGVEEVVDLYFDIGGIIFWICGFGLLLTLQMLIFIYLERGGGNSPGGKYMYNYRDADVGIYRTAMAAYPLTLGAWEGMGYVGLKAANSIYDKWSAGDDSQANHPFFYVGMGVSLPIIVWIIIWIRKSYGRFPTTHIFPLELGTLTVTSCMGGLFVYEEHKMASGADLVMIFVGIVLMMVRLTAAARALSWP